MPYSSEFKNILVTSYQMSEHTENPQVEFCSKIIEKIGLKSNLDLCYIQNSDFFFKFYHSLTSN